MTMMPLRWSSLLRLALTAVGLQLYCAPLRVLEQELSCYPHCSNSTSNSSSRSVEGNGVEPQEQFQDVMFLRMWLTFALTLYALCGVISKQVVLVSLLHAAIHFARSISEAPPIVASPSSPLLNVLFYWQNNSVESCVYEYGALLSFALLLRYVLFPPASALATFQRHRYAASRAALKILYGLKIAELKLTNRLIIMFSSSRNLKRFFAQHDKQFVPLVDRLLEEYTGHERLLYARIRRLYNSSSSHKTPGASFAQLQTP